jgi:hypothetical protein
MWSCGPRHTGSGGPMLRNVHSVALEPTSTCHSESEPTYVCCSCCLRSCCHWHSGCCAKLPLLLLKLLPLLPAHLQPPLRSSPPPHLPLRLRLLLLPVAASCSSCSCSSCILQLLPLLRLLLPTFNVPSALAAGPLSPLGGEPALGRGWPGGQGPVR